jgi:two-component system, chemotaxis family, sensor kinase CheA
MAKDPNKYKDIFLSEAKELVASMNRALLELEKTPEKSEYVGQIFRAVHTLKSMAASMKYEQTATLCHAVEDVLEAIKTGQFPLDRCVDTLFECFDTWERTLKALQSNAEEAQTVGLVERLRVLIKWVPQKERPETDVEEPKLAPSDQIEKIESIEVKVEKLDALMNLAEEFLIIKMRLDQLKEGLDVPEFTAAADTLGRLVNEMQYNVMQTRMVEIGFVFDRFPRMVRDLAKAQKKDVELKIGGGDLELDRVVIDEIGEALVHLLRNAVDHGLESPDERKKDGKPSQGRIQLAATRAKNFAVISVEDDGAGLDLEAIKAKAVARGILSDGATQDEIIGCIFSGLSTTKEVTAISGRGLGMDIVKKKVESLGGTIKVQSHPKTGTKFDLEIPLTLAVIKTLLVRVGGRSYAIPLPHIERLVTVNTEDIKGMMNFEAVVLAGEDIPMTRLHVLFDVKTPFVEKQPIVIVSKGEERLGLAVDELLGTQEIVIKPLHRFVRESEYFAGTAIVGSGEAILVLDVGSLILSKRQVV